MRSAIFVVPSERWTVLSGEGRWLFIEVCLLWNFRLARCFYVFYLWRGHAYITWAGGWASSPQGQIDNYTVPNFYNSLISERYINNETLYYGTLFCFISFTNIKLLLCAANIYQFDQRLKFNSSSWRLWMQYCCTSIHILEMHEYKGNSVCIKTWVNYLLKVK